MIKLIRFPLEYQETPRTILILYILIQIRITVEETAQAFVQTYSGPIKPSGETFIYVLIYLLFI